MRTWFTRGNVRVSIHEQELDTYLYSCNDDESEMCILAFERFIPKEICRQKAGTKF